METNTSQPGTSSNNLAYDLREFRTVDMLIKEFPGLISKNSLRWILRHRHENGLGVHTTRLGKHLLIHVPGFTSWLMRQNTEASN